MADWLSLDDFEARSAMPPEDIDRIEQLYPGFTVVQLRQMQSWIESRLRKRYAIPFQDPVPEIALSWLVFLVTPQLYMRRGWNPSSAENQLIIDAAKMAQEEIKEAADSKDGLFELPLRQDLPSQGGVSAGGPLGYSEASPYRWTDLQIQDAREEDSNP